MLPGQEPYTERELEVLYALVADAARAAEVVDERELEDAAEDAR